MDALEEEGSKQLICSSSILLLASLTEAELQCPDTYSQYLLLQNWSISFLHLDFSKEHRQHPLESTYIIGCG